MKLRLCGASDSDDIKWLVVVWRRTPVIFNISFSYPCFTFTYFWTTSTCLRSQIARPIEYLDPKQESVENMGLYLQTWYFTSPFNFDWSCNQPSCYFLLFSLRLLRYCKKFRWCRLKYHLEPLTFDLALLSASHAPAATKETIALSTMPSRSRMPANHHFFLGFCIIGWFRFDIKACRLCLRSRRCRSICTLAFSLP